MKASPPVFTASSPADGLEAVVYTTQRNGMAYAVVCMDTDAGEVAGTHYVREGHPEGALEVARRLARRFCGQA